MPRIVLLIALLLLALPASPAQSRRVDTTLAMSDGVSLAISYFVPSAPRPAAGFPGLLLVHGFAGSRDDYAGSYAPLYADSGYFAVAYTVRGQGAGASASGGEFAWFTGAREIADCRDVLAWMKRRADLNSERIGIEGISQGGLTSWGAAIADIGVRCAVPVIAVPRYVKTFSSDGCINGAFQTILLTARQFNLVRLAPFLRDTLIGALEQDRFNDVVAMLQRVDLEGRERDIRIPVFVQCAWQDEIFNPGDVMRAFATLRTPSKLMVWPGGHTLAGINEPERLALTLRFYRHWLRDDTTGTIMSRDSSVLLVDAATNAHEWLRAADSASWLPSPTLPAARLHMTATGGLTTGLPTAPLAIEKINIQNISNEMIVFRSAPFGSDDRIIGARASLPVGSSGMKFQADILLYDYDSIANTHRPITRGCHGVRRVVGESGHVRLEITLIPQLYTLAAGHQLEAAVKFGTPAPPLQKPAEEFGRTPWPPQESCRDTLFSSSAEPAWVELLRYQRPAPAHASERIGERKGMLLSAAVTDEEIRVTITAVRSETLSVELLDLAGRRVARMEIEATAGLSEHSLPTEGIAAGAYLLRVGGKVVKVVVR